MNEKRVKQEINDEEVVTLPIHATESNKSIMLNSVLSSVVLKSAQRIPFIELSRQVFHLLR